MKKILSCHFFEPWLEQPCINWLFYEYLNAAKKKHDPRPIRQEQPTRKDSISIEISNLLNIHKDIINPDQISEENIDHVKSLAEQTWSTYQQSHKEQIKKKKIHYKIEVIAPGSKEQQTLLDDLTKIKKNVLWVVLAANMAFYTMIVTFSTFSEFFVFRTNIFSFCLICIFGLVQLIQTICMILDSIKSTVRRLSNV